MAFDSYIQISGVEGQSTDSAHSAWIDVISFKHGSAQETKFTNNTNAIGRGVMEPFIFVHLLDKATPLLQKFCMSGQNIETVKFEVCAQIGGGKQKVYEVDMKNARVVEAQVITVDATLTKDTLLAGVGRDSSAVRLVEQISLIADEYKWTTHTFKSTGELAGDVAGGWNVGTDTAL
ncbi:MAG: type VI secretion system tube protein Hcp [Akkermansia sp.]